MFSPGEIMISELMIVTMVTLRFRVFSLISVILSQVCICGVYIELGSGDVVYQGKTFYLTYKLEYVGVFTIMGKSPSLRAERRNHGANVQCVCTDGQ